MQRDRQFMHLLCVWRYLVVRLRFSLTLPTELIRSTIVENTSFPRNLATVSHYVFHSGRKIEQLRMTGSDTDASQT